ncbi:MAG: ParB/RepB/Spo0J family partition protein [Moraxellaceae bacterium]|nr:ParB/RepB/Spo0J family partition protein [Moraxellaceae bacterium]MDZ4298500.1 ParB/RepB/Spo0J family partition protein [Moraxellaceae bacterium]MDZ4386422.1 ParB/RepB/Spo0J family partition protein [Moraxellaceae bacterium]
MVTGKKRGLGGNRGLDALLGTVRKVQQEATETTVNKAPAEELRHLPVEWLFRGRYQPRREMDPEALQELADSISAQGMLQPIVARAQGDQKFEIIAGERRWRAAQLAKLDTVPVWVREISDEAAIALALIENIQREDLNPLEEAIAMQRFADEFALTHQQVADAVGKSRAAVSNLMRLLALQDEAKRLLENGDIDMGHARALLALPVGQQGSAARQVVARGLSVRQTESLVRQLLAEKNADQKKTDQLDPNVRQLQVSLSERIGAPVQIDCNARGKGRIVIAYNSLDELDGILAHIK